MPLSFSTQLLIMKYLVYSFLTLSLFFIIPANAVAQKAMLDKTIQYITSGDIKNAKASIDMAAKESSTIEDPQTWYLKGYVYKELLKQDLGQFGIGHESLAALRKSINLDKENKYAEECLQVFQYIYYSWFNEGVRHFQEGNFKRSNDFLREYNNLSRYFRSTSPNPLSFYYMGYNFKEMGVADSALFYFNQAERSGVMEPSLYLAKMDVMRTGGTSKSELMEIVSEGLLDNPDDEDLQITYISLLSEAGDFEKAEPALDKYLKQNSSQMDVLMLAGTIYYSLSELKPGKSEYYFEKQRDVYQKAVNMNPGSQVANYNLGITYYNRGVDLIKGLSYDLELDALKEAVEISSNLFLQAKPYIEKVYQLNKQNENALLALISIYYNLNEMEKSEQMNKELSALKRGR